MGLPIVGVVKGTSYEVFSYARFPNAKFQQFDLWEEIVDAIAKGKITAAFGDINEIRNTIKNQKSLSINLFPLQLKYNDNIYCVVRPDFPALADWISKIIKNDPNLSLTYEDLVKKYETMVLTQRKLSNEN